MTAPGDVIGQVVVNVRTCADLYRMGKAMTPACQFRIPATPSFRCAGCQGDGTWLDTSEAVEVAPRIVFDFQGNETGPVYRPVENGDTGDGAA